MAQSFGKVLKEYRAEKVWRQKDLLDRIDYPISLAYMTQLEQDRTIPSPELIYRLELAFEITDSKFFELIREQKISDLDKGFSESYYRARKLIDKEIHGK